MRGLLNRPSQKTPLTPSSLLARLAIGSLSSLLNQLKLDRRSRSSATRRPGHPLRPSVAMTASNIRQVRLTWAGEGMVYEGGADGGPQVVVDSASERGPSPMQLLLLGLAGCMAIDVTLYI